MHACTCTRACLCAHMPEMRKKREKMTLFSTDGDSGAKLIHGGQRPQILLSACFDRAGLKVCCRTHLSIVYYKFLLVHVVY